MQNSQNSQNNEQYYFPRNRHNSRSYGYNHFYDSPETRRLRTTAAALVEQERRRRHLIDMEEMAFREKQTILERQRMEQERRERTTGTGDFNIHHEDDGANVHEDDGAYVRGDVATKLGLDVPEDVATSLFRFYDSLFSTLAQDDEEEEEEETGISPSTGTRMEMEMESPPVLADMDTRPYDHGYAHSNLFRIPVDGNHGTEEFPHRKPRTKTEPESHPVPPESAYAFIPNPHGGGFGDLQGAVLNHVYSQRFSEESADSDSESERASASGHNVDSEVDGPAIYEVGRDADGRLHLYKIGLGTKEKDREISVPETCHVAKGSAHAPDIQQSKTYRSTPVQHTSASEKEGRSKETARTVRHANKFVEENIVHPEDAHPYRVVIDNEGRVHRIQLDSPKQSTASKCDTIAYTQPSVPGRTRPAKPMRSKPKEDEIVHSEDTHPYRIDIDNEGHVHRIQLDRHETCNAAESSLYHQKLMEKEMRKHEYVAQERGKRPDSGAATKATVRDPTSVTHEAKQERDTEVTQPIQDDNHTPLGQMDENAQKDLFHRDDDVRYDVAQALVPEYYADEPHPYEFIRGTDGNLHALEEKPPKSNKAHELKEVKKPVKANYRYIQDEDGTIHRLQLDDSMQNFDLQSPTLVAGLEDASDSECENVFDDSKHNLRPRIGEWIEPEGEAELRKTERLRANNS